MTGRVEILGVQVDPLTSLQAMAAFGKFIRLGRPALVFNVNVDILMKLRRNAELRAVYQAADLVLADGTPMVWASRLLGAPLPGRVSGSDFLPDFCRVAAREGYRLFFLGARPGVADRAREELTQRHPGLNVVGTYAPPLGFEGDNAENQRAIDAVRRASPDVLFVGLGFPKQERWLHRHRDLLRVPVSMSVGSAFDFASGRLKRAPLWMQRAGLEWTYRLVQEPRRLWKRYLLDDLPFGLLLLREWADRRRNQDALRTGAPASGGSDWESLPAGRRAHAASGAGRVQESEIERVGVDES